MITSTQRRIFAVNLLLALAMPMMAASKTETPHLVFVNEYLQELAAVERIRDTAKQEAKQAQEDGKSPMLGAVHSCTLWKMELRFRINVLREMHLEPPFETVIPLITDFYEHKIALYDQLIGVVSAFIAGPKPGVDYGDLAAEMPKIRAKLDYIDQSLFDMMPLVFATLIDRHADSKDHLSHLIITKAERSELLDEIALSFGSKLEEKDKNYEVGAVWVLRANLLKNFKSSDEPWE